MQPPHIMPSTLISSSTVSAPSSTLPDNGTCGREGGAGFVLGREGRATVQRRTSGGGSGSGSSEVATLRLPHLWHGRG